MHLKFDLDFFPALRDLITTESMIALRERNLRRLEAAKRTDGNIFRPVSSAVAAEHSYPRNEA